MPLDDHFKRRYIELQEEYDFLTEEISELRHGEKTDDLRPRERARLKRQIAEEESKRERVQQELQQLDRSTNSEQLYRALLKLGYEKQVRSFARFVYQQSVSAFLIHGSVKYGQRWLLNRLVNQYIPESICGRIIKIELSRAVRRNDIQALWRELGKRVFGHRSHLLSPLEITEGVYNWWQTEHVLFVFHDVNLMPPEYLEQIISEFWQPLANKARRADSSVSNYQLLMFLLDYDGSVGNLDHLFAEQLDVKKPDTPVKPPSISKFTSEEMTDWVLRELPELPIELTHKFDDAVQEILAQSEQGIPEYVLAGIFERCGYNYYEEVERLWKL